MSRVARIIGEVFFFIGTIQESDWIIHHFGEFPPIGITAFTVATAAFFLVKKSN